MTPLTATRPAPAGLPPSRCPDCGAALSPAAPDVVVRCACHVDVGAAFSDADGHRVPVRVVFSTTPERNCAACGGLRRRVLVGADAGVACDGCGVVVRRPRPPQLPVERRVSRAGLLAELGLLALAIAGAIALWWRVTAG